MSIKKDNRGAMSFLMLGFMLFIIIMGLLVVEMLREYQSYSALETYIQRSLTASVQQNISYRYMADGKLYLYINAAPEPAAYLNSDGTSENYESSADIRAGNGAWSDFLSMLGESLGPNVTRNGSTFTKMLNGKTLYTIEFSNHEGTDRVVVDEPYMTVTGKITFHPMFTELFGNAPMETPFTYKSKEFHVDKPYIQAEEGNGQEVNTQTSDSPVSEAP